MMHKNPGLRILYSGNTITLLVWHAIFFRYCLLQNGKNGRLGKIELVSIRKYVIISVRAGGSEMELFRIYETWNRKIGS